MTWQIHRYGGSALQRTVTIINDDPAATPTTDYHTADGLARKALAEATLITKGCQTLSPHPIRVYASQAY